MKAKEALDELYAFAVEKAYERVRDVVNECGYNTEILENGIFIREASEEAVKQEFGTEKVPPKPSLTQAIYDLEERLKNL